MNYYGDVSKWGFGIVEDINDPLRIGRVRVRVYGLHDKDRSNLPTTDLPWSQIMLPTTSAGVSGVGSSPTGLQVGSMVYGSYLDGESKQNFLVMGSVPGVNRQTRVQNEFQIDPYRLIGQSNAEQVFNFFAQYTESEELAAGILAAMVHTVGIDLNPDGTYLNNRYGLGLWDDETEPQLREFAAVRSTGRDDLRTQLELIRLELSNTSWPTYVLRDNTQAIAENKNQASDAFIQLIYRLDTESNRESRENLARQALGAYGSVSSEDTGSFPERLPPAPAEFGTIISTQEELMSLFYSATRPISELIVHHTDTFENQFVNVQMIDEWHKTRPPEQGGPFSEIGYHFIILRDGRVQVGRNINRAGAHTLGRNSNSIGVAFVGGRTGDSSGGSQTRSKETFTAAQWSMFDVFVSTFITVWPNSAVLGHNEADPSRRTDPEFDVRAYVASHFTEWQENSPEVPALARREESSNDELTGPRFDDIVPPFNPISPPSTIEPSADRVAETTGSDILEPAPAETIVLRPRTTPPSVPSPFTSPVSTVTGNDLSLPSMPGSGIDSAVVNTLIGVAITSALLSYSTTAEVNTLINNALTDYVTNIELSSVLAGVVKYTDSISSLDDVDTSSPTTGQYFRWNGSVWAPATIEYSDINGTPTGLYTSADFDVDFASKSTSDLGEGSNLYYTTARVNSAVDTRVTQSFVNALGINATLLGGQNSAYHLNWNNFTNVPTTFTPASHTHAWSDITSGVPDFATRWPTWSEVTSKPTTLSGFGITDAVPSNRTVSAGNGLTGGGALSANITLTLGTPGTLGNGSTNAVTASSHTHALSLVAGDIPNLAASKITSGVFNTARLGSGSADSGVFLRGDGTWASVDTSSVGDAATLNGQPGSFYRNASNINAGTLGVSRLPNEFPVINLGGGSLNTDLNFNNIAFFSHSQGAAPSDSPLVSQGLGFSIGNNNSSVGGMLWMSSNGAHRMFMRQNLGSTTYSNWTEIWTADTFNPAGKLDTNGNGSGITNLNASNISTGTLADARLPSSAARLGGTQTFTGNNTFTGIWRSESTNGHYVAADPGFGARLLWYNNNDGNFFGIFHRNVGNLEVVRNGSWRARFSSNGDFAWTGTASGNGSDITNLDASNISSGTLSTSLLNANDVFIRNRPGDFWSGSDTSYSDVAGLGYIGTNGAFRVSIMSNGYRNSSGGWTSLNAAGNTNMSGIELDPGGTIRFLAGAPSGTSGPLRMTINENGAVWANSFSGNGAALTNLNASNISSGTINTNRLPSTINYTLLNGVDVATRDKIRVWNHMNFTIGMDSSYTFGHIGNNWVMTFQMSNDANRGFWWGHNGHTKAQGAMSLTTDGRLYVGQLIDCVGDITAYASDIRLKSNITLITSALDKVMQIRGVEYDWNDNVEELGFHPYAKHETGLIAQEVQKVLPDAVRPAPFDNNYLTIKYERVVPLLVEAIKEQETKNRDLENRIKTLEDLINKLYDNGVQNG